MRPTSDLSDAEWQQLIIRLMTFADYNLPELIVFPVAFDGLVYNHSQRSLKCTDCGFSMQDITDHIAALARLRASDPMNRCRFLNANRTDSAPSIG